MSQILLRFSLKVLHEFIVANNIPVSWNWGMRHAIKAAIKRRAAIAQAERP